jgi:hypothetical protein
LKESLRICAALAIALLALLVVLTIFLKGDPPITGSEQMDTQNASPRQGNVVRKKLAPQPVPQPEPPQRQE